MVQSTYKPFVDRMISRYEGGYGWNAKDPGGPTKYGITCYDLAEHLRTKMTSMKAWAPAVQAITLETAEAIYADKYASFIRYDDLPAGVDAVLMDYAINSGIHRATRVARALLGLPGGDVKADDALIAAIKAVDPIKFIDQVLAERLHFMHQIRGGTAWAEFGGGWSSRVADLDKYADHLATGAAHPEAPDLTHIAMPKATNVPKTAGVETSGSAVGGGIGTVAVNTVTGVVPDHTGYWIAGAVALTIIVIGIAYEAWQIHKSSAANDLVALPAATPTTGGSTMLDAVKARYQEIHASFHNSSVIAWARVQVVIGSIWAVLAATDLAPIIHDPKWLTYWLILNGVVTEMLRRRKSSPDPLIPTDGSTK